MIGQSYNYKYQKDTISLFNQDETWEQNPKPTFLPESFDAFKRKTQSVKRAFHFYFRRCQLFVNSTCEILGTLIYAAIKRNTPILQISRAEIDRLTKRAEGESYSTRTLSRNLNELEEQGFINRETVVTSEGYKKFKSRTTITINFDRISAVFPELFEWTFCPLKPVLKINNLIEPKAKSTTLPASKGAEGRDTENSPHRAPIRGSVGVKEVLPYLSYDRSDKRQEKASVRFELIHQKRNTCSLFWEWLRNWKGFMKRNVLLEVNDAKTQALIKEQLLKRFKDEEQAHLQLKKLTRYYQSRNTLETADQWIKICAAWKIMEKTENDEASGTETQGKQSEFLEDGHVLRKNQHNNPYNNRYENPYAILNEYQEPTNVPIKQHEEVPVPTKNTETYLNELKSIPTSELSPLERALRSLGESTVNKKEPLEDGPVPQKSKDIEKEIQKQIFGRKFKYAR